ncbi:MAG: flavin reductase family protein [Pseudomonadota bacterium]
MKKNLGQVNALYPSLTTIVGAHVDGRPNFLAVAHVGIMNHGVPQYISIGLGKVHHTNQGIHANRQFSVNIPSVDLVAETDYVGLVSGKNTDKSRVFDLFYGELEASPMISACPVTMECALHDVINFPTHDVFIGRIVATHADESVLKNGKIDIAAVRPLLFDLAGLGYFQLGDRLASAWKVGKQLKVKSGGES